MLTDLPSPLHGLPRRLAYVFALAAFLLSAASPARAFIFDAANRWTTTASGSTGAQGNPITLTWSLVRDGANIPSESEASSLIAKFDAKFGAGPGGSDLTQRPWFHLFANSFDRWSQLGGITFKYEPNDGGTFNSANGSLGSRGDIRIGAANIDGVDGTLAYTYLPVSGGGGGDMVIDTADLPFFGASAPTLPDYLNFRDTLIHEIGHAFGLEHVVSTTSDMLMEPVINTNFDGPQLDDIRAIQYFYGDALEKSHNGQGNDTASLATSLGTINAGGSILIGEDAAGPTQFVAPTATDFVSIDGTDVDYFSFNVTQSSTLNALLTPRGGIFNQASDALGDTPTTFNANARADLALALFAPNNSNGTTLLTSINNSPTGGIESLSNFALAAGQYFVRITGTAGAVQLYELALSVASAVTELPGDYNRDGIVDAGDYNVWRDSLGQSGSSLAADGSHDNLIDLADYDVWRTHFGETAGSGSLSPATAPEPSTVLLAITAFVLLGRRRKN